MHKNTKLWLIIAASLILIGCCIFGGAITALQWDFTKLSTDKYETNNHSISDNFKNIAISTDTADIAFVPSESAKSLVVCHEQDNTNHIVSVKDETLIIELIDTREWYERIGISVETPTITVYLPNAEYQKLSINESTGDIEIPTNFCFESMEISTSTGNIENFASAAEFMHLTAGTGNIFVENISANSLDLSVSTGKIIANSITCRENIHIAVSTGDAKITNAQCNVLHSSGSTGDLSLHRVIAKEQISIVRNTGDVYFKGCDAAEISIKTSTGDVNGSFLSDKVFLTESNTGRISVPQTTTGGKCEIITDTGDIKITIEKKS